MMATVAGTALRPAAVTDTVGTPVLFESACLAASACVKRTASPAATSAATIASSQITRRAESRGRTAGTLPSSSHTLIQERPRDSLLCPT